MVVWRFRGDGLGESASTGKVFYGGGGDTKPFCGSQWSQSTNRLNGPHLRLNICSRRVYSVGEGESHSFHICKCPKSTSMFGGEHSAAFEHELTLWEQAWLRHI